MQLFNFHPHPGTLQILLKLVGKVVAAGIVTQPLAGESFVEASDSLFFGILFRMVVATETV